MSLTKKSVTGVKWNGITLGVRASLQFLKLIVLARLLTPANFGLVGMATVITGFISTFQDLGLENAVIYKQDATKKQLSSLYWFNVAFSWLLYGIVWLMTPLAVMYYREPEVGPIIRWAAATFLFSPFSAQLQGLLRREFRFKERSLIQVTGIVMDMVVSVGGAIMGLGAMSLVWGILANTIITVILTLGLAARQGWLPMFYFNYQDLSVFLKFGLLQSAGRMLKFISTNVDYLIIGRFLGAESLGYYTLAYNLMRLPVGYINPLINTVAFSAFSRVQNEPALLRQGYAKIISYLGAATLPILIGMFAVADILIPVMYGAQWLPAIAVIRIFCLLGVLMGLNEPLESPLLARGRPDVLLYLSAFSIAGYAVSNLIGSQFGIMGVAISSLVFYSLVLVPIQLRIIQKNVYLSFTDIVQSLRGQTIASVFMGCVVFLLSWLLQPTHMSYIVLLGLLVLVGGLCYCVCLWLVDQQLLIRFMTDIGVINIFRKIFGRFNFMKF